MIRFLLKSAFWLSLAFIAVPHFFPADQENKAQENKPHEKPAHEQAKQEPSSIEQILANGKTAVEIGKLCMDNPSFCKSGTSLVSSAGSGFLEGSRVMLEYLSARLAPKRNARARAACRRRNHFCKEPNSGSNPARGSPAGARPSCDRLHHAKPLTVFRDLAGFRHYICGRSSAMTYFRRVS